MNLCEFVCTECVFGVILWWSFRVFFGDLGGRGVFEVFGVFGVFWCFSMFWGFPMLYRLLVNLWILVIFGDFL